MSADNAAVDRAYGINGFEFRKRMATIAKLDANIRPLIEILNTHSGIATIGSCGGHENPTPKQHPAGHWFVSFMVYIWDGRGDMALAWVRRCINRFEGITLISYDNGKTFFLNGQGVTPAEVAQVLQTQT